MLTPRPILLFVNQSFSYYHLLILVLQNIILATEGDPFVVAAGGRNSATRALNTLVVFDVLKGTGRQIAMKTAREQCFAGLFGF